MVQIHSPNNENELGGLFCVGHRSAYRPEAGKPRKGKINVNLALPNNGSQGGVSIQEKVLVDNMECSVSDAERIPFAR